MGGLPVFDYEGEEGDKNENGGIPVGGTSGGKGGKPEMDHKVPLHVVTYKHGDPTDPTQPTADEKNTAAHKKAMDDRAEDDKVMDPSTPYDGTYTAEDVYTGGNVGKDTADGGGGFVIEVKADEFGYDPKKMLLIALGALGAYFLLFDKKRR